MAGVLASAACEEITFARNVKEAEEYYQEPQSRPELPKPQEGPQDASSLASSWGGQASEP